MSFISFGYAFNSKEFNAFNGVRVIRISDFNSKGFINKNIVRYNANNETYDKYKVIENSILICMTGGTVGKSLYVDKLLEKMLLNQRIAMIYTNSIEIRYVDVTINSDYIQKVISKKKNSTNDNISAKDVNNFLIPLPPLAEQKRIVEKFNEIEFLINLYEQYEQSLNKINDEFSKQLEKSILQYAIQGKLVKQNIEADGYAKTLIDEISKQKQLLVAKKEIKSDKQESFIFKGQDNKHYEKIGEKITCIQKEIPFEIPNNWEWVRLGSVSFISFGYAFNSKEFNAFNGVRVIRISDFNSKGFINKNIVRYNANNETYDKYKVIENSILICMTGGTVGKSLYVDKLLEKMLLNQRIAMIYTNSIEIRYVDVTINSDYIQKVISKKKNSTNDNISAKDVNNFLIPLPPLNEQKRIINKIDSLLQKTKFLNFKN